MKTSQRLLAFDGSDEASARLTTTTGHGGSTTDSFIKPKLSRSDDGWWILGYECGPLGPYETKSLAAEDMAGVRRFYEKHSR